jgi:hypothetical protein
MAAPGSCSRMSKREAATGTDRGPSGSPASRQLLRVASGFVAISYLAGCGGSHPPASRSDPRASSQSAALSRAAAESAATYARHVVASPVSALLQGLRDSRITSAAQVGGNFVACGGPRTELTYSDSITTPTIASMPVAVLTRKVVAILRADGWQLTSVNLAQMPGPVQSQPHPDYRMKRPGLDGAANILPGQTSGSQAIIFVNSACFNAGPIAAQLQGTPPGN